MNVRLSPILPLLALPWLALPSIAQASSPTAWAAFDTKVARQCERASGLRQPHASRPIGFDDTLGKVVALVSGDFVPRRGRAAVVKKLCVFDQRSGRVWLSEADGWSAPAR